MHTTIGGLTYRRYRARGMGYTYDKFVEWCATQNVMKADDDWPWISWGFADQKSNDEIRLLWGAYITDEEPVAATKPDREEADAAMDPVKTAMADEFFGILMDEIQREINNELADKIKRNA